MLSCAETVEQHGDLQAADVVNQPMLGSAAMTSGGDAQLGSCSEPVLLAPSIRLTPSTAASLPRGQRSVETSLRVPDSG